MEVDALPAVVVPPPTPSTVSLLPSSRSLRRLWWTLARETLTSLLLSALPLQGHESASDATSMAESKARIEREKDLWALLDAI